MQQQMTVLSFSPYDNPYDPKSNSLLAQASRNAGVQTEIVSFSRDKIPVIPSEKIWLRYDIRSGNDLKWVLEVAAALRNNGHKVFPSPKSIWVAEDKWETHLVLQKAGVPIPKTFRAKDLTICGFPAILKTRVGWGGMGNKVVLQQTALQALPPFKKNEYICQSFIPHSRTLIIAIAGATEICCIEDQGNTAFDDGRMAVIPSTGEALALSLQALQATGLVTGTVDLIESPEGIQVLEVNSAPRITYPHLPGVDLANPMVKTVLNTWERE